MSGFSQLFRKPPVPDAADLMAPMNPSQQQGGGVIAPTQPAQPEIPLDPYALEEQFANLIKSLQQQKQQLDSQYLLQMASQGRIMEYTNRRIGELANEDQQQSIARVSDAMPFVNWRAPGAPQQVDSMLQDMATRLSPEMAPHIAGLQGRAKFMADQSNYLEEAKSRVSAAMDEQLQEMLAAGSVAREGEEPRGGIGTALLQFGEGLTGSASMGLLGGPRNLPPRERLAAAGQLALEKASKEWTERTAKHPGRGHIEDVAIDEGAMRDVLSRFSVEHLEKRGKQYGLRDTTMSEVSRKMGELAGWLVPFGAAGKGGQAALRYGVPKIASMGAKGAKVAQFMARNHRAVEAIPTMLIFGAATKFADSNVMARATIEQSGVSEQEKEAAREFQGNWDAMVASVTVPAAWIAGSLGRLATGGASKMLSPGLGGFVETAVGFPAAMEAANRSATATRDLVVGLLENDEQTERAAKLFSIANPTVRGHVEEMLRGLAAGDTEKAWENALAYGKEVAIGAPVFAASHVMQMHAPQLLTRDRVEKAKREIIGLLPPEQRAAVLAAMDGMVPAKPKPTPDAEMAKQLGAEEAARKIVQDRVTTEVGEILDPADLKSEQAREAAYDAVEARELAVEAGQKYEKAREAGDKELAIGLKEQELQRLQEARDALEAARALERGETPAERVRPSEGEGDPEAVRSWVRDQLEGDHVRAEQAARLAERPEFERRAATLDDKLRRAADAAGGDKVERLQEAEDWAVGNLRPGDVLSTQRGEITLDAAPFRDKETGRAVLTGELEGGERVRVNLETLAGRIGGGGQLGVSLAGERKRVSQDPVAARFLEAVSKYEQAVAPKDSGPVQADLPNLGVGDYPRGRAPKGRHLDSGTVESLAPSDPGVERGRKAAGLGVGGGDRGPAPKGYFDPMEHEAAGLAGRPERKAPEEVEHPNLGVGDYPRGAGPKKSPSAAEIEKLHQAALDAAAAMQGERAEGLAQARRQPAPLGPGDKPPEHVQSSERVVPEGCMDPAVLPPDARAQAKARENLANEVRGSAGFVELQQLGKAKASEREAALLRMQAEGGAAGDFAKWAATQDLAPLRKFGGERASAELLYRWLHEKTEGGPPSMGLYERMADLHADVARIADIKDPQERAKALVRWSERLHAELAGGAMVHAARTTKKGTEVLNALSDLEAKLFGPAQAHGGFGLGLLVKFAWPWARTGTNLRWGMTPANRQMLAERSAQLLAAESFKLLEHLTNAPDTGRGADGKPHLPFLRRFAPSLESGHSWMGDLSVGMDHVFGKTHQNLATYHRGMFERGGRLRTELPAGEYEWKIRAAIKEGRDSSTWNSLSEAGKRVASELVEQWEAWREALVARHPYVARSERLLDVFADQLHGLGAREAKLDLAVERGQKSAADVANLKRLLQGEREGLVKRREALRKKLAEFKEDYGLDNYVHAFRAESDRGIGDYRGVGDLNAPPSERGANPMKRRRNLIPEEEQEKDIRKIAWKYAKEMIPALEYNGFLAQNANLLWGRERALTEHDMVAASTRPHFFENGVYESMGRWKVDRKAETAERADDGGTLVLLRVKGRQGEKTSTKEAPPNLSDWKVLQREIDAGNVKLVSTALAPYRVTIKDGGFLTEALDLRVRDMQDALARLRTLARDHRMSVKAWTLPMRWVGGLLNTAAIGMFSIPTAMTAAAGAALLNGHALHPGQWVPTMKSWLTFMTRMAKARGVFGMLGKPPAEPMKMLADIRNGITLDFGEAGKMRTPEAELAKMSPERRAEQEILDDGMEALVHSSTFQNSLAEWMTGRLLVEGSSGSRVRKAGQSVSNTFQWLTQLGYIPMQKFAEVPARSFLWLGKYAETRKAGNGHEEAVRIAEAAVTAYHGQFNPVTQNAFYRGPLGPMFGGIQTWASHMVGRLAKAPKSVAVSMAAVSTMTLALARALGLDDDLTHVLGGSVYELPGVGRGIQTAVQGNLADTVRGTGWEELVKTGFLPGAPLPQVGSSPGFRFLEGAKDLAIGLMTGQGDMAWDEAKRTLGATLTPATMKWIHRSFFTDARPDGRFDLRQIYYAGLMKDQEPAYTLNSQGIGRLLLEAAPGTPGDVAAQIHQGQILRSQQEVSKNRATKIRREAGRVLTEFEARKKAGGDTTEQRTRWKELAAAAKAEGRTIDPKSISRANKLRGLGYVGKAVAAADSKNGEILSLARVLENPADVVGKTDVARIFTALRGRKTMRDWVNDDNVPAETRKRFHEAYRSWRARQTAAAP